jgi:hypothetical protein
MYEILSLHFSSHSINLCGLTDQIFHFSKNLAKAEHCLQ